MNGLSDTNTTPSIDDAGERWPWRVHPPGTGPALALHDSRSAWALLNATGREVVQWLSDGDDAETAARRLSLRYGIDEDRARADVQAVQAALAQAGPPAVGKSGEGQRFRPGAQSLYLQLTQRCNLRCGHCYVGCAPDADLPEIPTEAALDLLGRWQAYAGGGVALSGGEPLAHPGFGKILAAAARGGNVSVLTNGTLVDDAAARSLAEAGASVQVSLDGPDAAAHDALRGPGSFAGAMRGLRLLRRRLPVGRLVLSCTLTADNLPRVEEVQALAAALGVDRTRFLPLRRAGHAASSWPDIGAEITDEAMEAMFSWTFRRTSTGNRGDDIVCGLTGFVLQDDSPDGLWCPAARKTAVDARGNAYPCVLLMQEEFCAGNVLRNPLEEVLTTAWFDRVRARLARRVGKGPACGGCPWRGLCQGGCLGAAIDRTGDVGTDMPAPHCTFRKKLYAQACEAILARFAGTPGVASAEGREAAAGPVGERP